MSFAISLITHVILELFTLTGSLGVAIIIFTLLVRSILLPLTLPSLRAQKKMKELQPEISKLKKKYGKDKQALQKAQMELYKKYNVNPLAGCIPQLVQIGFLILLYRAMIVFLGQESIEGVVIDLSFLWLNLANPDSLYILPVLAGLSQFVLSLMIAPGAEKDDVVPNSSKKKAVQKANEKEEDFAEMAASMQQQMLYIMPVMTAIIALRFPSGLALYWVVTTVFSVVQQWFISGPGGLVVYAQRAQVFARRFSSK